MRRLRGRAGGAALRRRTRGGQARGDGAVPGWPAVAAVALPRCRAHSACASRNRRRTARRGCPPNEDLLDLVVAPLFGHLNPLNN